MTHKSFPWLTQCPAGSGGYGVNGNIPLFTPVHLLDSYSDYLFYKLKHREILKYIHCLILNNPTLSKVDQLNFTASNKMLFTQLTQK